MKRDDDLIRELLFRFEADDDWFLMIPGDMWWDASKEERKESYHVRLMGDEGLVAQVDSGTFRLTNAGHDFLEAIRDDGLWEKTKNTVAETGGSATLEIIMSLAEGFLKKKISQHTGIEL